MMAKMSIPETAPEDLTQEQWDQVKDLLKSFIKKRDSKIPEARKERE